MASHPRILAADAIVGEGFTQSLNAAILAGRGHDLRRDIVEAIDGNDLAILEDTDVVADLVAVHGPGLSRRDDLADLVGAAICDARGVDFTPGERFVAADIAVAVLTAWAA